MQDLQELVKGFLTSQGYRVLDVRDLLMVVDRPGLGGDRDTRLLWVLPAAQERSPIFESRLLRDFEDRLAQYPKARLSLVTPTLAGFSRNFRTEASRLGVTLTVPVLFFDTPFKYEEAPEAVSIIKALRQSASSITRIAQPFSQLDNGEPTRKGDDLYGVLFEELKAEQGPCLTIVVGPAGAGKSVLFQSLFASLYDYFLEQKRSQQLFPRPIPLLPNYLPQTSGLRTEELVESFLRADVALPVLRDTFEWMLVHGLSMWLWDGLDELYAGDPEFFTHILEWLTWPHSRAKILLCARSSLLATSQSFASFLEEFRADPGVIRMYRLEDWRYHEKRVFVWSRRVGRLPKNGEQDPAEVAKFLTAVNSRDPARRLSGVPYFCDLLLEVFWENSLGDFAEDFELIQRAVDAIIEREVRKGLLKPNYFEPNGLQEWLETVGLDCLRSEFRGLRRGELEELGRVVLREELSDRELKDAILTLMQFPLFESRLGDTITFKHELVAEYLGARYLSRRLLTDPAWVARSLGARPDFASSLVARYLARLLSQQGQIPSSFLEALRSLPLPGQQFANLLQILLLGTSARDVIRQAGIVLEGRDLSYVQFVDRDLRDVSFRNCNLSGALFKACDLRATHFEGAVLSGTRFEDLPEDALRGATFGDLEHFEHIMVDRGRIDDFQRAAEWVRRATGDVGGVKEPCPTALQLTVLFQKFVYPNGVARRDELPRAALSRGKKYPGAPAWDECEQAAIRFGYLKKPDWRDRVRRESGDRYSEMVAFVRDRKATGDLRNLLNALCPIPGCEHLPRLD